MHLNSIRALIYALVDDKKMKKMDKMKESPIAARLDSLDFV